MVKTAAVHAPGAANYLESAGSVLDRLLVLCGSNADEHGPTQAATLAAVSLYSLRDDTQVIWIAAAAIQRLAAVGQQPPPAPGSVVPGQ